MICSKPVETDADYISAYYLHSSVSTMRDAINDLDSEEINSHTRYRAI